ncbi:MAG TPA: hypothetical protein VFS19_03220 [Planctomycetota bacterium]|nr:hypothetical protein [Planctomycetota bacterium]
MIKGKWVILSVLAVAVLMGLASWPLLRLRRKNEIYKTKKTIEHLRAACDAYKAKHGGFPKKLADLDPARGEPLDAWGRSFEYDPLWDGDNIVLQIRSLGSDRHDPHDDLPPLPPWTVHRYKMD